MAESKFLNYQDKTGDGLIDVCEDVTEVEEVSNCPDKCIPNGATFTPDWKTRTIDEPFLNEKDCFYYITAVTKYSTTGADEDSSDAEARAALREIYLEYHDNAAESLLINLDKDSSNDSIQLLKQSLYFHNYDLNYRQGSRLKLLYTVPSENLSSFEAASEDTETTTGETSFDSEHKHQYEVDSSGDGWALEATHPDEIEIKHKHKVVGWEVEEAESDCYPNCKDFYEVEGVGPHIHIIEQPEEEIPAVSVTYSIEDFKSKLLAVRKGLSLYSRYYRVYNTIDAGVFVFSGSKKVFTKDQFDNYGDIGFGPSILYDAYKQLESFLAGKNMYLGGLFKDKKVSEITLTFSGKFKLTKLEVVVAGCEHKPKIFRKKTLNKTLNKKSAFKDPTAMSYLAKLDTMENDLKAREPRPWVEFMVEYTYPPIVEKFNYPYNRDNVEDAVESCVAKALEEEGKQFGQDLLDEVFGLGDAIAYQFHKRLCKKDNEDLDKELKDLGLKVNEKGLIVKDKEADKNMRALAKEQAFKTVKTKDQVFVELCARFAGAGMSWGGLDILDEIWNSLDRLKVCGLTALAMDAVSCLFGSLTLEEGLSSITKAALKGMSVDNLGDLFVGLPPAKKEMIKKLADQKLASGQLFKPGSNLQDLSDQEKTNYTVPWEDSKKSENIEGDYGEKTRKQKREVRRNARQNNQEEVGASGLDPADQRTLAQQYDVAGQANKQLNQGVVIEAYASAIIEVYASDLLGLVDLLNKYPGAQLIAKLLAPASCTRPPVLDPNMFDFIKSIDLPFCQNNFDIVLPALSNPFGWLPKIKDFSKALYSAIRIAIQQVLVQIMMKLMMKICELIGKATCEAMALGGDMLIGIASGGREEFAQIIKESLCGEEASNDQVDKAIEELFENLGPGAAELANKEQALQFAGDISSATTRRELMNAFLGNCSPGMLDVADGLIEYEYPNFRQSMPNKQAICNFFKGVGNVFPADVKDAMKDFVDELPEDDQMPANPSLCATPEQLKDFCDLRKGLMTGRASPTQIENMCENLRGDLLGDMDDLQNALQGGLPNYIDSNMPPLMSDPGCNNGIIPFETEEAAQTTAAALSNQLEMLKVAYSKDLLNNGPGERNWGLINMILSDTTGRPYTSHVRKASIFKNYVDFYGGNTEGLFGDPEGAFPEKVAEWLQQQMGALTETINFESNNELQTTRTFTKTFDQLGIDNLYGAGINYLELPDLGYNVVIVPDAENQKIKFVKPARKKDSDLQLYFEDNAKGLKTADGENYSYGYAIDFYLSDLQASGSYATNLPSDNARVVITDFLNQGVNLDLSPLSLMESAGSALDALKLNKQVIPDRRYEFLAVDDTLDEIDNSLYTDFLTCFEEKRDYIPQVILLKEILNQNDGSYSNDEIKTLYDSMMTKILTDVAGDEENPAFSFGAQFDDLSEDDIKYVVNANDTLSDGDTLYSEAEMSDEEGGTRLIENDDMVMGVSRMQWRFDAEVSERENRVFYLDPSKYGGSYNNPPVYIKPVENKGWLGLSKSLFPDLSPCKPSKTDLVDFGDIQDRIQNNYNSIPEDERLESDPECVRELPYHKILDRASVAGLEGLILALIRIFCSVHVVKSMATFSKFKPDFPNMFSSLYASYIVENMQESFLDAQSAFWEALNPFKDTEFWYLFLEQAVQMYSRKMDSGEVQDPTQAVVDAMVRINDAQEQFQYPYREDLTKAKEVGEVGGLRTLKNYRLDKKIDFLKETEEYSKIVLIELVKEQLSFVGDKVVGNLEELDLNPKVTDLGYYVLQNFTQGGLPPEDPEDPEVTGLELDKKIVEQVASLPTEGSELYTTGGEFVVAEDNDETDYGVNDDYVGYYHVHSDDEGNPIYMAGEFHTSMSHDLLKPVANQLIVPIGDVEEYGFEPIAAVEVGATAQAALDAAQLVIDLAQEAVDSSPLDDTLQSALDAAIAAYEVVLGTFGLDLEAMDAGNRSFLIEKYISIDGEKYNTSEAIDMIKQNNNSLNISDVYPGTLQQVANPDGDVVGLVGFLGVRYGLQFSMIIDGEKIPIAVTEVDALDLTIGEIQPFEGNSKLLLCLINNLKEHRAFKLMFKYIFSLTKLTSLVAIYNDMGFLPSIGEITVSRSSDAGGTVTVKQTEDSAGNNVYDYAYTYTDGWQHKADRSVGRFIGNGIFYLHFDKWDQELLINSKARAKKLFKEYYNSKDMRPPNFGLDLPSIDFIKRLRKPFNPRPGAHLFPRWRLKKLKDNPFDANGQLCEKDDT
jgi:hypothetical protein